MKAWVTGDPVEHDDLNGNFLELSLRILAIEAARAGSLAGNSSHVLSRDGGTTLTRDGAFLTFR